jgi:hypothetical protein
LKMDPIEGSETSANINQTLGIHPKIETVNMRIHFRVLKLSVLLFYFPSIQMFIKMTITTIKTVVRIQAHCAAGFASGCCIRSC